VRREAMIRALLFDLDGTLWDSEAVRFRSWQRVFEEHGQRYTIEAHAERLGTIGGPDPLDELEAAGGARVDREDVRRRRDELTADGRPTSVCGRASVGGSTKPDDADGSSGS
jgi:beta-phosphoglucomutase-like phosphatase (HAD superfamily)